MPIPKGTPDPTGRHTTLFICVDKGQATGMGKNLEPSAVGIPNSALEIGTVDPSTFLFMSAFTATLEPPAVTAAACSSC